MLTMLTFAPVIDGECTRRVLHHYALPYREVDRLFGWVSLLTLLHGGYGRIPLAYGQGRPMSGPSALVRRFDVASARGRLMPSEQPLRQQVAADFALYNGELARDVARIAYFHLLPERELMIRSFGGPITAAGRAALPIVYPALQKLFDLLLGLTPARVADATTRVTMLLDRTDARLSDGRRYLVGDHLSMGDIGLASAMAPILVPPAYQVRVPAVELMPSSLRDLIMRTRERTSGTFVLRLYDELA